MRAQFFYAVLGMWVGVMLGGAIEKWLAAPERECKPVFVVMSDQEFL